MIVDLVGTNASEIQAALLDTRHRTGSSASGMVLTLVLVTDENHHYEALRAATEAAREHPSRILVAIARPGRGTARLDAEVRVGGENSSGEVVLLRAHAELAEHLDSIVLPMLLPDAPVVAWWPADTPDVPSKEPLGALAMRRVTDASEAVDPIAALAVRADGYVPGDTDLAWTRLTPWRTLLASMLDEGHDPLVAALVEAEAASPSAELLSRWLADRLGVPVGREESSGPGITSVRLRMAQGELTLTRPDGRVAILSRPGQPDRSVALPRRGLSELIAEELRRLDPDEVYGRTLHATRAGAVPQTVGRTS
ncbi:MAG: glucose-6-phosphate dehydrogenase assembly protein OpcA [Actinomycetes bacterium]